jgi:uncharacterized protein YeaO (DUF488 family)
MAIDIQTKRVYDPAEPEDDTRVLVDRLWPRGLTKELVKADLWLKEVAPSAELRKWFHQDMSNWEEFRQRYYSELDGNPTPIARLLELSQNNRLTLLFSSREADRNHALALKEYLLIRFKSNT